MEMFSNGKWTNQKVSDTKNVIVVYYGGKTTKEEKEKLLNYLTKNGFILRITGPLGFGTCPWRFINLDNKIMVEGKPGVEFAKPYIKHAVLIDEFIDINEFYKKYKTLDNDVVSEIFDRYKDCTRIDFYRNKNITKILQKH